MDILRRWALWRYVECLEELVHHRSIACQQTGACIVYTPERGIDLDMLRNDVKYLKKRYHLDAKGKSEGRLVLR